MPTADLRGPSADALESLTGRVARTSGSDATRLGDDLFAVASLLRDEPALRRVVTDVSTEGEAKSGLARSVLADQVFDAALDLVAEAAGRRWTRSRDLADALEHLGVEAVVRSAEGGASRLSDELFAVRRLVDGEPSLRTALGDPARSTADRSALIDQLLAERTQEATRRLVRQALVGSHRTVSLALEAFEKVAASVDDQRVATVRTARPLGDAERSRLQASLARSYGRDVHLDVVVDPSLIGGARVEIGDDVIDGTVAARLDEARRKLAG